MLLKTFGLLKEKTLLCLVGADIMCYIDTLISHTLFIVFWDNTQV